MTRAADAAAADAGPQRGTAAQAAARARRAKARVACAASLLRWIYCMVVHGTGWDPAVASSAGRCHDARTTRPRQPDQRFDLPAPAAGARDLPPRGGGERARLSVGVNPASHPGQLSPGRPELLTSSVERCRGRPARIMRAGRARLTT